MLNDFSTISAESISTLAMVTPEETAEANAFYDALNTQLDKQHSITPAGQQINKRSWGLLDEIHNELAPKMKSLQMRDLLYG